MTATTRIVSITLVLALTAACAERHDGAEKEAPVATHPDTPLEAPIAQSTVEAVGEEAATSPGQVHRQPSPEPGVLAKLGQFAADAAAERRLFAYSSGHAPSPMPHIAPVYTVDRENYIDYPDNGVMRVAETPVSTFSIDVDTAGYANVRRMLAHEGRLPPTDAVRLEEMINYFNYDYASPPASGQPFSIHTELAPAPWSDNHHLLQVGLKGFEPEPAARPPANLVFLVDVSGSMRAPNKLELVKKSLRLLVNRMRADDRIAIAVYAGAAGTALESTPGDQKAKILAALQGLEAGGSTHGSAGIELAYALAEQHRIEGGINRVIIASDGDMNVGTVDMEALKDLVARKRERGIALSTLGFGSGNYNYALMEQMADVGNGNAAYIDSLREAQKVLVSEMQSTLLTIASDVKVQVEFNPATVSEYRLIGYENRLLEREDFDNDKVDAGDIGAGHTVTALYEIVLAGSGGERIPDLRYARREAPEQAHGGELAHVKLRYKAPGSTSSELVTRTIDRNNLRDSIAQGSTNLRFAASVAGFGQLLKGGTWTGSWDYDDALALARGSRGNDPHGYRGEFVHLIELAQSLSSGS